MLVTARGGFSYFITFIDDHLRYGYVYLMRYKSEAFENLQDFKAEIENRLNKSIKSLRFDRGGEYLSKEFQDYLREMALFPSGLLQELHSIMGSLNGEIRHY